MKRFSDITKCNTCGYFYGFVANKEEPSHITRGFCRCQPEGWEICSRHKGRVRRRYRTSVIINEDGRLGGYNAIAMMAPCRKDSCFKPSKEFLAEVQEVHDFIYKKKCTCGAGA